MFDPRFASGAIAAPFINKKRPRGCSGTDHGAGLISEAFPPILRAVFGLRDRRMNIDIAKRVYDHTWKLDPIVRSLLDTDFYKLLMLQPIHARHETVRTTLHGHQPHQVGEPRRGDRRARAARATRPCPDAALHQARADLARRQHLLRQAPDLPAGVPGLARRLPAAGLRAAHRGRRVRAGIRGAVEPGDDVGGSGARRSSTS